ncbi:MAG TPA: alpha/beta hydrolase [Acidimicrobiales bacterium]|nr:alpha/beta hydrolase [Acidimicrobiales bacterium]
MSGAASKGSRRLAGAIALGVGAAAAAGWVLQHRSVTRALAGSDEGWPDELKLPEDLTHRFIEVDDGGRLHVVEGGSGPPLVLLHGFMLDSTIWAAQFRDLRDRYRVIAIDQRGHGRSVPGADGFGARSTAQLEGAGQGLRDAVSMAEQAVGAPAIRRMASDLAEVLEALDVSGAQLVGHSMGGMVTLQFAQDHAETLRRRVSGIALVSTTAGPFVQLPGWASVARAAVPVPARTALLGERLGVRLLPSRDLRYWVSRMGFGGDAPLAHVKWMEELLVAAPARTVSALLPSLAMFDLSASIESIEEPVLVVVGSHDHLTPPRHARRLAAALPHAQLVELARCGHMPMVERPHELSHMLDEFSAKTSPR